MGGRSQYLANFWQFLDFENFYKCLTFLGGKKHFFSKSANNGLVLEKKYIIFSVTLGGGPDCNICYNFFFKWRLL